MDTRQQTTLKRAHQARNIGIPMCIEFAQVPSADTGGHTRTKCWHRRPHRVRTPSLLFSCRTHCARPFFKKKTSRGVFSPFLPCLTWVHSKQRIDMNAFKSIFWCKNLRISCSSLVRVVNAIHLFAGGHICSNLHIHAWLYLTWKGWQMAGEFSMRLHMGSKSRPSICVWLQHQCHYRTATWRHVWNAHRIHWRMCSDIHGKWAPCFKTHCADDDLPWLNPAARWFACNITKRCVAAALMLTHHKRSAVNLRTSAMGAGKITMCNSGYKFIFAQATNWNKGKPKHKYWRKMK